jgi:peptidylprolyl isomerase
MSKSFIIGFIGLLVLVGGIVWLRTNKAPGATTELYGAAAGAAAPATPTASTPTPTDSTTPLPRMNAVITTNQGVITLELFGDRTPNTVQNFTKLAQEGFYNGTKFHRVIKDFMIQGGDPLSKDDTQMMRWGTGGPGYQFADEITAENRNDAGTISMANAGPNTNGSQFFINTKDNNFLDPKHTVFGRVVEGMDVVMKISTTETGPNDRPVTPMVIESVVIK